MTDQKQTNIKKELERYRLSFRKDGEIPYYFLASDALCPRDGVVFDPFCGTGTVLLEAILSGRNAFANDLPYTVNDQA